MKKLPILLKKCLICQKEFKVRETSSQKYCTRKCYGIEWGIKAEKFKKDFLKGHIPWNKGKKLSFRPRLWQRGIRRSIKSEFKYKNGGGKYVLDHRWIKKQLGTPSKCQICDTIKARVYQWANISNKYERDIKDWARLCVSCHRKFDTARYWRKHKEFYNKAMEILR